MTKTVKLLLNEHRELIHQQRIWEEVVGFLEKCSSVGDAEPLNKIRMEDGSLVDQEVVLDMISAIEDTRGSLQRRLKELENTEVGDGKDKPRKKAGTKRVQSGRARKSSTGARKTPRKGGGKSSAS